MRIISDFHDYYDSVQRHGSDPSLLYVRKRRTEQLLTSPLPELSLWFPLRTHLQGTAVFLGFCGRIYRVLNLTICKRGRQWTCPAYSYEEARAFIEPLFTEAERLRQRREARRWPRGNFWRTIESFFSVPLNAGLNRFFANRCPIWLASWPVWTIAFNPCLREELPSFIRHYSPAMAYQEIAMWLANQALPEKPIPKVSDEVLAEAKGFDKYSFRKDKSR